MKLRPLVIILLACLAWLPAFAQQDSIQEIQILESVDSYMRGVNDGGTSKTWFINGKFKHKDAIMWCDSAYLNNKDNTLEAYGDVMIVQADTITLLSDQLFYNGNKRLARMYDNISLTNGKAVLTTDFMTYDMAQNLGTYNNGGQIVNETDTLTSKTGYYYANSKDAYFRENAVVKTPRVLIESDTLHYNTETRISDFYGPTTITGKDDLIYAENGTYNTNTDIASFQQNAYYQSGGHLLKGDSLYYDRKRNFGQAIGNVYLIDTVENVILQGGIGVYNKATEEAYVTRKAFVTIPLEGDSASADSAYIAADTLRTRLLPRKLVKKWIERDNEYHGQSVPVAQNRTAAINSPNPDINLLPRLMNDTLPGDTSLIGLADTVLAAGADSLAQLNRPPPKMDSVKTLGQKVDLADPIAILNPVDSLVLMEDSLLAQTEILQDSIALSTDSLQAVPDSARVLFAFDDVRIYKTDFQAIADSLVYTDMDSVIRCFGNPVLWSDESQMSGEHLTIALKNKKVDNLKIYRSAFIANRVEEDSTRYNQMSGKDMVGTFKDGELTDLLIQGNAQTIYYIPKDSKGLMGVNYAVNSNTRLLFEDEELVSVVLEKNVDQTSYPLNDPEAKHELDNFRWHGDARPISKSDIFRKVAPIIVQEEKEENEDSAENPALLPEGAKELKKLPEQKEESDLKKLEKDNKNGQEILEKPD